MSGTDGITRLPGPTPVEAPLPIKDLAVVLIKHYGFSEGYYEPTFEFQIGVGAFGPDVNRRLPGAVVTISKVGLLKAANGDGPNTVDAAVVNPAPAKAVVNPAKKTRAK